MPTVGEVIDRVYRSYLLPADDQPAQVQLSGSVDDATTSWVYDDAMLAADEQELLGPGQIVEAGGEQALVTAVDTGTSTLTVVRGANGTTPTSHADGDLLLLSPGFPRQTVFDAVADHIVALHPWLHTTRSVAVTSSDTYAEVPSDTLEVVDYLYLDGDDWVSGSVVLRDPFPPSTTGKAVQFHGVPAGKSGHLLYRGGFERPESEDQQVFSLGVAEEQWIRIVEVGAAAQVLAGRELDTAQQSYLAEQLRAEGYPPMTALRQASGLWQTRDRMLQDAARRQRAQHPVTVSMSTLDRPGA